MLRSLALIFLLGIILGSLSEKIKLPALLGMILAGMLLGPFVFNLLDESVISVSQNLRQIALVIILARAGLSLNLGDLKKVGRPAILMSFIPASLEILGVIVIASQVFNLSFYDSALMGTVLAAVSPAVVVPRMIKLIDENYGTKKGVPQLVLVSSSVDDIFVIVLFTSLLSMQSEGSFNLLSILQVPTSIIFGIILGVFIGFIIIKIFKIFYFTLTQEALIFLSLAFLCVVIENHLANLLPISGLIAIMAMGILVKVKEELMAENLGRYFNKLWSGAEILLFVLLGASVNLEYARMAGFSNVLIVIVGLVFRMLGVLISLLNTHLNKKEKLFTMLAYTPKATVQAAIGSLPLSMGLGSGEIILTVAVIAILITAPLGGFFIDISHQSLLSKDK